MPAVLTVMLLLVALVLHLMLPVQPVELNVAVSPVHKLFLFVLITGAVGLVPVLITRLLLNILSPQLLIHVAV